MKLLDRIGCAHLGSPSLGGQRSRRGMTVLELSISTVLLIALSGSLTAAMIGTRGVFQEGSLQSKMQDAADRALGRISQDLRRSGFTTVGTTSYPYLFDDGAPNATFTAHAHAPATENADPADADFGVNRDIVFVQPQMATDVAGDEAPQLDANGLIQWSGTEISYSLRTGADGVNYLERRTNGANPRRIANHVERLVFDDPTTSAGAVPNDSVRVQIFFRQVDEKGVVHRHQAEVTVALRNS
ncbi:MAG: hypothetical protein L6Q99_17350 [Planctomycetes bacterium]|nr:hypothetical protein [Planctomycetota bacterium]